MFRWLLLVPVLLLVPAIFAAPNDAIHVDVAPAVCTTRYYDPQHPDKRMPATLPDEAGVTVSDYACDVELRGTVIHNTPKDNDVIAEVRIDGADMNLKLNVAEWVSQTGGPKILAHESGHGMISLHFYAGADDVAASIARKMLGRSAFGTGLTPEAAQENALNIAAAQVVRQYMVQVRDRSAEVQLEYDVVTQHGTNRVDEMDAIRQALSRVDDEHAQTQPAYH